MQTVGRMRYCTRARARRWVGGGMVHMVWGHSWQLVTDEWTVRVMSVGFRGCCVQLTPDFIKNRAAVKLRRRTSGPHSGRARPGAPLP